MAFSTSKFVLTKKGAMCKKSISFETFGFERSLVNI